MGKKKITAAMALLATSALTLSACGSGFDDDNASGSDSKGDGKLSVLIASSGDAEAKSVKDTIAKWADKNGVDTKVDVASDLVQQLAQGFAGGNPPDLFYTSADQLQGYAESGYLQAYGDDLKNKDDFYPSLRDAFTHDGKFYCAPKDFSTLALIINTAEWEKAGLTDADYPKDWDQLKTVAAKLTKGDRPGLTMSPEFQRMGAFLAQAGGGLEKDGKAIASAQGNKKALQYLSDLAKEGSLKLSNQLGSGWGGEAFGKGQAAMVVEGNWVEGALKNDYPDLKYKVVELPAGPAGKATLQFTNCWGLAADSKDKADAKKLAEYLTEAEQQNTFAKDFGVMPSVKSAAEAWKKDNPALAAFLDGADYAQNVPTAKGATDVLDELNSKLEQLPNFDIETTLEQTQKDMAAVLK